jgi:hypothetical protein
MNISKNRSKLTIKMCAIIMDIFVNLSIFDKYLNFLSEIKWPFSIQFFYTKKPVLPHTAFS